MLQAMADDVRAFGKKLTMLAGPANVSYTPGIVLHIWHGDRADRDYTHRYQILLLNNYDPVCSTILCQCRAILKASRALIADFGCRCTMCV